MKIIVSATVQSKDGGGGIGGVLDINVKNIMLACIIAKTKFMEQHSDFDIVPGTLSAKVMAMEKGNTERWTK